MVLYRSPRRGVYVLDVLAYCFGSTSSCVEHFQPFPSLPGCSPGLFGTCGLLQFPSLSAKVAHDSRNLNVDGKDAFYSVSIGTDLSSPGALAPITHFTLDLATNDLRYSQLECFGVGLFGGIASSLDPNGTETSLSPAMRKSKVILTCSALWASRIGARRINLVERMDQWFNQNLLPLSIDSFVLWAFPQRNVDSDAVWQSRYWGGEASYASLREVKDAYDQDNVLTCFHCVGWEDVENVDPVICPEGCSCSNMPEEGMCAAVIITENYECAFSSPHSPTHHPETIFSFHF